MYGVVLMMALGNGAAAVGVDEAMDRPEATPYASHGQQLYRHRRRRCCCDSGHYGGGYGCGSPCGGCGGCGGGYGFYGGYSSCGGCDGGYYGGFAPYGGYSGGASFGDGSVPYYGEGYRDRGAYLPMPREGAAGANRSYYDNQERNAPAPSERNRQNPDGGNRQNPDGGNRTPAPEGSRSS